MCIICDNDGTIPKGLTELRCIDCPNLINIELYEGITELDCSGCINLKSIRYPLPNSLEIFTCSDCPKLKKIPILPEGLTALYCSRCISLIRIPIIPRSLEEFDCDGCSGLIIIPDLPEGITYLDFSNCANLVNIPDLPNSIESLYYNGCPKLDMASKQNIEKFIGVEKPETRDELVKKLQTKTGKPAIYYKWLDIKALKERFESLKGEKDYVSSSGDSEDDFIEERKTVPITLSKEKHPENLWYYSNINNHDIVKDYAIKNIKPLGIKYITEDAILSLYYEMCHLIEESSISGTFNGNTGIPNLNWDPNEAFISNWEESFIRLIEIYLDLGVDPGIYLKPKDTFKFFSYDKDTVNKRSEYFNKNHPNYMDQMNYYNRLLILYKYYLPLIKKAINKRSKKKTEPITKDNGTIKELDYSGSELKTLPILPGGLKILNCTDCPNLVRLSTDGTLPEGLNELECPGCPKLKSLPSLPDSLKTLSCDYCISLKTLGPNNTLPMSLTDLNCEGCVNLKSIPILPDGLEYLNCDGCLKIKNLPDLPDTLLHLYCNKLTSLIAIPPLPKILTKLYCSWCESLKSIPTLPDFLIELICHGCTKLTRLPDLPDSLIYLDISGCTNLIDIGILPNYIQTLKYENCPNLSIKSKANIERALRKINNTVEDTVEERKIEPDTENGLVCGYIVKKFLGQGTFGRVTLVEDPKTGMNYAMKQFKSKPEEGIDESIIREMNMLGSIAHPNIIKPHDLSMNGCEICCILNFMDSSLGEYIKDIHKNPGDPNQVINVFTQIVAGIDFLHENKIIHNDLKPANILIKYSVEDTEPRARVSDLDCVISPENKEQVIWERTTLWYRAPEMIYKIMNKNAEAWATHEHKFNYRYDGYFSNKIDIWALGCILYELFHGKAFFTASNSTELAYFIFGYIHRYKAGIMSQESKKLRFGKIPPEYMSLLLSMLELEPEKRPTAREILHTLGSTPVPGICSFGTYRPVYIDSKEKYMLVEWLAEFLDDEFRYISKGPYINENVYRTMVNILYRYWKEVKDSIRPTELQSMACVCFLLACKLFDIDITLKRIVYMTDNSTTAKVLTRIECDILDKLKFRLYSSGNLEPEMYILRNLSQFVGKSGNEINSLMYKVETDIYKKPTTSKPTTTRGPK